MRSHRSRSAFPLYAAWESCGRRWAQLELQPLTVLFPKLGRSNISPSRRLEGRHRSASSIASKKMRVKTHTRYTGIMVVNFQAIETAIRAFLECQEGGPISFPR